MIKTTETWVCCYCGAEQLNTHKPFENFDVQGWGLLNIIVGGDGSNIHKEVCPACLKKLKDQPQKKLERKVKDGWVICFPNDPRSSHPAGRDLFWDDENQGLVGDVQLATVYPQSKNAIFACNALQQVDFSQGVQKPIVQGSCVVNTTDEKLPKWGFVICYRNDSDCVPGKDHYWNARKEGIVKNASDATVYADTKAAEKAIKGLPLIPGLMPPIVQPRKNTEKRKPEVKSGWVICLPNDPKFKGTDHYMNSKEYTRVPDIRNATIYQIKENAEAACKNLTARGPNKGFLAPVVQSVSVKTEKC